MKVKVKIVNYRNMPSVLTWQVTDSMINCLFYRTELSNAIQTHAFIIMPTERYITLCTSLSFSKKFDIFKLTFY